MAMNGRRYCGGKWLPVLGLVLVLGFAVAAAFLWMHGESSPVVQQPVPVPPAPPSAEAPQLPGMAANQYEGATEPPARLPPPEPPAELAGEPLPELDDSDGAFQGALSALMGEHAGLLSGDHLVRRIVVIVDNLPGSRIPYGRLPLRPAEGGFRVTGTDEALAIAPDNSARYAPYVRLAEAIPAEGLVALYARFYPLFQQAYDELGYGPDAQFNDRLVAVIDHLIAVPEPSGPIALVQPKIRYHFADPRLEALSAGQKIMVRMGRDNAVRVKARLREIRALLEASGRRR